MDARYIAQKSSQAYDWTFSYTHTHVWIAYMIGISGLSVPLLSKISLIQCRSSLVVKNGPGGSGSHDLSQSFWLSFITYLKGKAALKKRTFSPNSTRSTFSWPRTLKCRMNWQRVASHGGFHSTYAQIIEMLLDFYEKHRQQQKHDDNKKQAWPKPPLQAQGDNYCRPRPRQWHLYYTK